MHGFSEHMPKLRRRAWQTFFAAGLAATAIELSLLGVADALGSLTFAGRLSGVVCIAAAMMEVAALVAFLSYVGPEPPRHAGTVVLFGVLISLLANLALLVIHMDSWSYTPYVWVWGLLFPWSLWALWRLHERRVWSRVPHARGIATGVLATTLLAAGNFAYSQIYEPHVSPTLVTTTVAFGRATVADGRASLPVRLRAKNAGRVGVYVLGTLYQVTGRRAVFTKEARPPEQWRQDIDEQALDLYRHTDVPSSGKGYDMLALGRFISPQGVLLEPGMETVTETVVQFPADARYDVVAANASLAYVRKDRVTLVDEYAGTGRSSWRPNLTPDPKRNAPRWVTGTGATRSETFRFRSRIVHSNAVLEHTRAPHYVTLWWILRLPRRESPFGPQMASMIGPLGSEDAVTPAQRRQMADRYGLGQSRSGGVQKSVRELTAGRRG